jgi:hypothetical protein
MHEAKTGEKDLGMDGSETKKKMQKHLNLQTCHKARRLRVTVQTHSV